MLVHTGLSIEMGGVTDGVLSSTDRMLDLEWGVVKPDSTSTFICLLFSPHFPPPIRVTRLQPGPPSSQTPIFQSTVISSGTLTFIF